MQPHATIDSVYESLTYEKFAIVNENRLMRLLNVDYDRVTANRMNELQEGFRDYTENRRDRIHYYRIHGNIHVYSLIANEPG